MPRPEKVQAVADIKDRLEDSTAVFLAEYAGLSVGEQQELRRALRAAESEFKIVKMTLARIAVTELGHDELLESLRGPTGFAFASGDTAAAAKVLRDFAKNHTQLILKGGLLAGEPLTPERVAQLADLDSREVLLAKIAGAFQAPMSGMAGLLAAMPRNLASMLLQLIEKLPADEGEPAADTAPEADVAAREGAEEVEAPEPAEEVVDEPTEDAAAEASDDEAPEPTTDEDAAEEAEEE